MFYYIVSKVLLKPNNISRFCHFFVPRCADGGSNINFNDTLSSMKIRATGIFGNRNDIKSYLLKLQFGSKKMLSNF